MRFVSFLISAVALVFASPATAVEKPAPIWVGTWATSVMAVENKSDAYAQDTTLRQTVHVSVGGDTIRVILTNEFGEADLKIAGASVALPVATKLVTPANGGKPYPERDSTLKAGTSVRLTFNGKPGVTLAAGAVAVSDPLPFRLTPLSDLDITLLIPGQPIVTLSQHPAGAGTNFLAPGDQLTADTLAGAKVVRSWHFIKGVSVRGEGLEGTIVCLGDSITNGSHATPNLNMRWPDILARRLQTSPAMAGYGVLNESISGNRVLHDGAGSSALARFDRDVLSHPNVRTLIVLEGINDIGRLARPDQPEQITAEDLIAAYRQIIARAHEHGVRVIGATITPYQGAGHYSEAGEKVREEVNRWILTSKAFDGVADFDRATADPARPQALRPDYEDPRDHLHPIDAGYQAMAEAIDLPSLTAEVAR